MMGAQSVDAQSFSSADLAKATSALRATVPSKMGIGQVAVTAINADAAKKVLSVSLNGNYGDVPFTKADIEQLKTDFKALAGAKFSKYKVAIDINGNAIENYVMGFDKKYSRHNEGFITQIKA